MLHADVGGNITILDVSKGFHSRHGQMSRSCIVALTSEREVVMSFKPAPHVQARPTPDGLVLLDSESGAIFKANAIGASVWTHLMKGHSLSEAAEDIAGACAVSASQVSVDLERFVRALLDRGLLLPDTAGVQQQ